MILPRLNGTFSRILSVHMWWYKLKRHITAEDFLKILRTLIVKDVKVDCITTVLDSIKTSLPWFFSEGAGAPIGKWFSQYDVNVIIIIHKDAVLVDPS